MRSSEFEPALFVRKGGELLLSAHDLVELLRAVLARGAPFRFRAKGASMGPFIRDGDLVTVLPLSRRPPGLGDVVAFVRPNTGGLVLHRVVGRQAGTFIIMGDGNPSVRERVSKTNVLGRVGRVERDGAHIYLGLGRERALIAFLARTGLLTGLLLPTWRLLRRATRRPAG